MKAKNHLTVGPLDVFNRRTGLDPKYGIIIDRGVQFQAFGNYLGTIDALGPISLAAWAGSGQLAALLVHADAHVVDRRAGAVVNDTLAITADVLDNEG